MPVIVPNEFGFCSCSQGTPMALMDALLDLEFRGAASRLLYGFPRGLRGQCSGRPERP